MKSTTVIGIPVKDLDEVETVITEHEKSPVSHTAGSVAFDDTKKSIYRKL